MGTLVETDIDQFIRGHKSKLQQEREQLNQYTQRAAVDGVEETGLLQNNEQQEKKRQQLQNERQQEYNDVLAKRQQILQDEYRRVTAEEQRLAAEQQREGLQLGTSNRQKLDKERKREYNEYLAQKGVKDGRKADVLVGTGSTLPVGEYDDQRKQQLVSERQREYNEQLQQQKQNRQRGLPPKPATPNHFFKNIGSHERQKEMLNEERKKEYNQKLAEERLRTGRRPYQNDTQDAVSLAFKTPESAEKRKMEERNREYNEFLKQNQRKVRKGWATPTYEDILLKKRQEDELNFRQDDHQQSPKMRRYASEGAINRLQNDLRERELDKELELRKVRFDDQRRQQGGILEDDNWLNPGLRQEAEFSQPVEQQPVRSEQQAEMAARVQQQPAGFLASLPVGHDERESAKRRKQSDYRRELQLQMEETKAARKREKVQELRVNASGLLDPEKSSFRMRGLEGQPGVSPRREYKAKEVQPYHTKFLLDDSGDYDALGHRPGEFNVRTAPSGKQGIQGLGLRGLGGLGFGSGDDLGGLDLGAGGSRERGRRRERDPGILDPGFVGLLDSRRPLATANPPPGLMYQPSTYVTGGGGLGGPYSSIDEAYHYYGMKNPLDIDSGGVGNGIPNLNFGGDYGGAPGRPSPTPRVTFADDPPSTRRRDRSKERISPYQFPSDDELKPRSRSDTQNYGAELERQIQEKRMQKMREKEEQLRYEQKLEAEIANYNPFGRGGGGAPIKDAQGNAIADLRSFQRGGPGTYQSPRRESPVYSPRPPSPRDDKIKPPPAQKTAFGETTFARGGHGIFGQPKTDAEKDQSDKYKDDLREQIAEKRRREQMEKERERQEEEKENRRLEDQRLRMQSEYEEEQRKIKAREEETRRKNEELKRQADERKKEAERKRREGDDQRMKEQQEQLERERREREQREADASDRIKSPPIPTVKAKSNDQRGQSPPIRKGRDSAASNRSTPQRNQPSPAPGPSVNRPNSSDVLTQLASMRKQLQSERRRVENALENSKNEPDVFDPRTIQRPPPNKLIFENAMNKNASLPPPRAQTSDMANARNIQQFNELKFKADTDSRRAFRSMFPEAPVTNTTLEAQQDAMIRQQEEQLKALRDRNVYDPTPSNLSFARGRGNVSARSQLASNSAFIDVEGVNHFPEDFEDMAGARNDSARARRRDRFSPRPASNNGMGSQASLDVDRIQRKNEERLRRLNNMTTGDDVSMADPDDILDRFMAKQRYNRPPSGQTLQDDSWLRPGSKVV